jgi:hypothetical protein
MYRFPHAIVHAYITYVHRKHFVGRSACLSVRPSVSRSVCSLYKLFYCILPCTNPVVRTACGAIFSVGVTVNAMMHLHYIQSYFWMFSLIISDEGFE